jgi:hypothetical protein
MMDALVVEGNGASLTTLEQAGIGRTDLLLAVTSQDEINLMACLTAAQYEALPPNSRRELVDGVVDIMTPPTGRHQEVVELLNESRRLEAEAVAAEFRLIERCLEGRGHTVHDPSMLRTWKAGEFATAVDDHPHDYSLPDADQAAEWGFGQWIYVEGADPDAWKDWEKLHKRVDTDDQWSDVDDSAFEAWSVEEQYSWLVDYHGRAYAEWMWGEHFGIEAPEERGNDDGSLQIDHNVSESPPPGGCELEMIRALYGEPQLVETAGGGADSVDAYIDWVYRPAVPLADVSALFSVEAAVRQVGDYLVVDFRDRVAAEEEDFLDCLAERGHGNWTFQERGGIDIFSYWGGIYYGEESMFEASGSMPDAPADLPSDFESLKALEIAMAVDTAECADGTGLREAAETTWDQVNRDYYASVETDLYAWQEAMRDVIARAQEMLDA